MADTDHLESNCPILPHSVVLKGGKLTSSNIDKNISHQKYLSYEKEAKTEYPQCYVLRPQGYLQHHFPICAFLTKYAKDVPFGFQL